MISWGGISTGQMAELKGEKQQIRAAIWKTSPHEAGKLWLEYAKKCKALRRGYEQRGNEFYAQCESVDAATARQNAALAGG